MPTFIVIILDDSSAFEYTPELCPRIASFKKKALEFPNFYTHPVCTLSRHAFMFGSYGKKLGNIDENPLFVGGTGPFFPLPNDIAANTQYPSLASTLQAAGYTTCLVGKWHGGVDRKHTTFGGANTHPYLQAPISRGYDQFRAGCAGNMGDNGGSYSSSLGTGAGWTRLDSSSPTANSGTVTNNYGVYSPSAQVFEAIDWLGDTSGSTNRFLHVALNLPHAPFHIPPTEFLNGYVGSMNPGREQYVAMLRAADTAVGFILDAAPNTANIWLWSDNGSPDVVAPAGINPDYLKRSSHKYGTNVLSVFQQNGVKPGVNPRLMHALDIGATILSIAGIAIPSQWDSQPFGRTAVLTERQDGVEKDRSARTGGYLLRQMTDAASVVTEELFYLPTDPGEGRNIISDVRHAGALAYLRARLTSAALP